MNETYHSFSDTEVRCDTGVESSQSYRLIDIPYFCEIETFHAVSLKLLLKIERMVLTTLARDILSCDNEEIRRSLSTRAEDHGRVVAAYSLSGISISDHCE